MMATVLFSTRKWCLVFSMVPSLVCLAQDRTVMREADVRMLELTRVAERAKDNRIPVDERLAPLLEILRREITSPVEEDGIRHHGVLVTNSQLIQTAAVNAIAEYGDMPVIRKLITAENHVDIRPHLVLARSRMQAYQQLPVESTDWRELLDIVTNENSRYLRYRALRAMQDIAHGHPAFREEAIEVARGILTNPALRMRDDEPSFPGGLDLGQAETCLRILGVPVERQSDGSYLFPASDRDAWIELREAVLNGGYTVVWDQAERRADVTKGTHTVRLWADRSEAEVNGRMVPLERKPVVAAGRLVIPRSFVPHLVPKAP